jgi:putative endonuclease
MRLSTEGSLFYVGSEMKTPAVYILTNIHHTTFYTGVTSHLEHRMMQHQEQVFKGFSSRYNLNKLVYFEVASDMLSAIKREKYVKGKKRAFKIGLIESFNPEWKDLATSISRHVECNETSPPNEVAGGGDGKGELV